MRQTYPPHQFGTPSEHASIPNRDDDQEQTFAEARRQQRQTDLIKAELRATENVIEHLLQIIISLSVLTLDGANSQLKMTEGNRLFFFLSLPHRFRQRRVIARCAEGMCCLRW